MTFAHSIWTMEPKMNAASYSPSEPDAAAYGFDCEIEVNDWMLRPKAVLMVPNATHNSG
jgi:hypothetical protein